MKKSLLLGLALAAGFGSAYAAVKTPVVYDNACFQRFSNDGRFVISQAYGMITVYNLENGTSVQYGDGDLQFFSMGLGNAMTADGSILLGSTSYDSDAAYCVDGEWLQLPVPDVEKNNLSNGITPDGSRICGSIGLSDMTLEDGVIMQVPVYWDRNADGKTYGECVQLPYPTKDFFGDAPQYVTAICISDDGKTIAGQVRFGNGSMCVPIVYTQDDKGEWSYSMPTKDLFNPNNIPVVENPGDGPNPPQYADFMTSEEYEQYEAALAEYWDNPGVNPYPSMEDFMTAEEIAKFEEAQDAYSNLWVAWNEKREKYDEYLGQVLAVSPNFLFNNVYLSTDNKSVIGTLEYEDPNADPWAWDASSIFCPCVVDLATGTLTKLESEYSLQASGVADNGVVFAYNGQLDIPMTGYIFHNGEVQSIWDYLAAFDPAFGEWIKENMTHETAVDFDYNTWTDIIEEVTFTGMPISTPDMSKIAFWNDAAWSDDIYCQSVIFEMDKTPTGISTITAAKGAMKFVAGTLVVPADFVSVDIYNLSGACVKTVSRPAGAVKLDLSNGAYIAKGTRADGSVCVLKIAK